MTIEIKMVPLSSVVPNERNPKGHETAEIAKSIRRFGFVAPLLIDARTGKLVAGHGRLEALKQMKEDGEDPPARVESNGGEWMVPVISGVSFNSDDEANAYLIADNRLVEIGRWDDERLAELLQELREKELLDGVGYEEKDIDAILQSIKKEEDIGPSPEDIANTYIEGTIKQIVLYFKQDQYEDVVKRLSKIMDKEELPTHTEVFLKLLEQYENSSGREKRN